MYPPPQAAALEQGILAENQPSTDRNSKGSHMRSHSQAHSAPFAYEYVFEEGKMPFLAELHPIKTKDLKATEPTQETLVRSDSTIQRQKFLKRRDRQLQFDITSISSMQALEEKTMQTLEKTTNKLKRAFSLSGMKSTQSKYFPSATQEFKAASPPMRNDSTRSAPPAISPPVPSLVLPTPSPSPRMGHGVDPFRHSMVSNSSGYRSINFSLPRSSWASLTDAEDQMDLQFVRETAQGRFSSNLAPTNGLRRNKALAILGITEMPLTPPYTPSHSAAPSIYDWDSRMNSRRTSVEYRLSQLADKPLPSYPIILDVQPVPVPEPQTQPSTPPPQPTPEILEGEKTPKPSATQKNNPIEEESPAMATPRPQLKRKTSKFIEHIDMTPELKSSIITPPNLPDFAALEHFSSMVPLLEPPVRRNPVSTGIRRSQTMRTPSPGPSPWGNVVCMAEAQPIVAMGTARLITS